MVGQFRTPVLGVAAAALVGAGLGAASMAGYMTGHNGAAVAANERFGGAATDDQTRIVDAVARAEPSVVAIDVTINGTRIVPADPLAQLFGGQGGGAELQRFHARASGSGFVYSRSGNSGLIVTNAHVVNGASSIVVVFKNGDRRPGKVFADDVAADIALVQVNDAKLPSPLELGSSSDVRQGEWAIAIGEPFELKDTVTVGVVSGFNRNEPIRSDGGGLPREFKGLLQTSAPINPGNSGGPLLNLQGQVIGINQSTANPSYAQGIGFAIPADTVRTTVAMLEKNPGTHQAISGGFIGVVLAPLNSGTRQQLNYSGRNGVAVVSVVSGSPADSAGLEPGDVIQQIDGKAVQSPSEASKEIDGMKPGERVRMQVWSAGTEQKVAVRVGQRPM